MIFLLVVDNFCLNENYLNFINIVKIEKLEYLDCKLWIFKIRIILVNFLVNKNSILYVLYIWWLKNLENMKILFIYLLLF